MKCGQGKPFTVTSTNSKMGGAAVRSYEKGGIVEGSNPNIDDNTRDRARQSAKFVTDGGTQVSASPNKSSSATSKVVTKEELAKSGLSLRDYMNAQQGLTRRGGYGPGRKPSGPSQQDTTDTRDRFGIPTSMGNAGKNYAPTGKTAEPVTGTELTRNLEAAANATGAGGILQGVRRGVAVGKGLREFAAGRMGAKEVAKRVEPTMEAAKRIEPTMYGRGEK